MSRRHKERDTVFGILRFDGFFSADATPETTVTIKEVVRTEELAIAEVQRLNALRGERNSVRYWWQSLDYSPKGSLRAPPSSPKYHAGLTPTPASGEHTQVAPASCSV
jgi:hypothetical protein